MKINLVCECVLLLKLANFNIAQIQHSLTILSLLISHVNSHQSPFIQRDDKLLTQENIHVGVEFAMPQIFPVHVIDSSYPNKAFVVTKWFWRGLINQINKIFYLNNIQVNF